MRAALQNCYLKTVLSGRVREMPEWNPQPEFTSGEENNEFQGFLADGTRLFVLLLQQVEILIST